MARRKSQRRGAVRANRPRVEGLESRQLLAVTIGLNPLPTPDNNPTSIVRGPDNNLYFTGPANVVDSVANPVASIGVINPFTKVGFEFPTPNPTSNLGPIISGPNGGLWFVDNNSFTHTAAIGVFVPSTHAIGETPITIPGVNITGLAAGPDNSLYFTDAGKNAIGRFDPVNGSVSEFPLAKTNMSPSALVADANGNLWFGTGTPAGIGEFDTTTHALSYFTLPSGGGVASDTLGADGNVYFNEAIFVRPIGVGPIGSFTYKIASINPGTDAIKEYGQIGKGGITVGPDGNIWFATGDSNNDLTFTPGELIPATGALSIYNVPVALGTGNFAIATGPDGHLYVTDVGQIAEITPVPPLQSVVAGTVALDPAGGGGGASNPIAGQMVFLDLNNSGAFAAGDPSAVTDASGVYQIPGVAPGTYTVRLVASPGNFITTPAGGGQPVTVAAGQNAVAAPFTIVPTSIVLPLTYAAAPFGAHNPDVSTAEVNGLYRTILGRAPTAAELSTVLGFLKNGTPVPSVASALLHSAEYDADFVTSDYRIFLGINPPAAAVNAWVQMIQQQGLTAEQVAFDFMTTPEFNALHPGNPSFIQALYVDLLGRQASASEVAAWNSVLASGTTRAQAVKGLLASPFAAAREVEGLYSVFLNRPADPGGLAFWVAAVQAGTPLASVAAEIAGTAEFAARANATVG